MPTLTKAPDALSKISADKESNWSRLATFTSFPLSALIYSIAGFFWTGYADEVECYNCHVKIKDWSDNDDPSYVHEKLSPKCSFIKNNDQVKKTTKEAVTGVPSNRFQNDLHSGYQCQYNNSTAEQNDSLSEPPVESPSQNGPILDEDSVTTPSRHREGARNTSPVLNQQRNTFTQPPLDQHGSVLNQREQRPRKIHTDNKKYESTRLASYQSWPMKAPVTAEDLAKAGFFFVGPGDRVECAFCHGILKNWEVGDNPFEEHKKHFRHCSFAQGNKDAGNVTLEEEAIFENDPYLAKREVVTEQPMHANYALPTERLRTYKNFPKNLTQKPEALTRAGFFYTGTSDNVKCFFCDGGLRNWERNDDPWVEHAKWFPRCGYLRLCKNDEFIARATQMSESHSNDVEMKDESRYSATGATSNEPLDDEKLKEYMEHPLTKAALDMNLDKTKLLKVIQYRLQEQGPNSNEFFPNIESMIDAYEEYKENEQFVTLNNGTASSRPNVKPDMPKSGKKGYNTEDDTKNQS